MVATAKYDVATTSNDLNPIGKHYGMLARRVYVNGKEFRSTTRLGTEIVMDWDKLHELELFKLAMSVPDRFIFLI